MKQMAKPWYQHPFIAHPFNMGRRIGQTASVAGQSAVRIVKGEKPNPDMLREAFENLGVTYIKIGQFIASMPSIFPKEYVAAFQSCLDQTTPVPFNYIEQVLKDELITADQQLTDFFLEIDPKPLASASIAQVHAATLKDGTKVVLKVQKPNVKTIIEADLGVLFTASKVMELFMADMKHASLAPIVDEIRQRMAAETDFISEANNIADFQTFLQQTDNKMVVAPEVINELTTRRVLTMTRLHGVSMIDTSAMQQYCNDPARIMSETLNTWFASVMQAKSFHADLHAGNLMLLTDGRIGFIDFGIVGQIKPSAWQACMGIMDAMQKQDFYEMAQNMIAMGMTHERDKIDVNLLAQDLKKLIDNMTEVDKRARENLQAIKTVNTQVAGRGFSGKDAAKTMDDTNHRLLEIMEVGKRHGLKFPRDFVLLTKQLLYFDRFMSVLAPGMNMFADQGMTSVTDQ